MATTSVAPKKRGRPRTASGGARRLDQITVHLSPELVGALDEETKAQGLQSRSELIREACRRYLEQRHGGEAAPSATQRMRGLSARERQAAMTRAADALAGYYRTDPEVAEWQALDGEDVYDVGE